MSQLPLLPPTVLSRKLSSVEESRHSALEIVKTTWNKIDDLLAPLCATTVVLDDRASRTGVPDVVPQIVTELDSPEALGKLNRFFDVLISSLAAAVARIQLRYSPSPTNENLSGVFLDSQTSPASPTSNQIILLEDEVLEYVISENILLRTLGYSIHYHCPDSASLILRWNLLRILETLVSSCLKDPRLLSHESILVPLLGLFDACTGSRNVDTDRKMMAVMNELTYCLKQAPDLLQFFIEEEGDQEDGHTERRIRDLRILSYLYPHIHNPNETGQLARSAVLALLRILQTDESLNIHVAEKSSFCPVLINGLTTFYYSLPQRCFGAFSPGWHRINVYDITCSTDLQHFTEYLEFCNAAMQLSAPIIRTKLTESFHQLFLMAVITPAITQFSTEELTSSTAYFDYIVRTLQDSRLRMCILDFIITATTGDRNLSDHLIGNILSTSSKVSMVTMALFHTLLDMNYEPLLDHLILRYLNEARPFLPEVISSQNDPWSDLALADELLKLTPACCNSLGAFIDCRVGNNVELKPISSVFDKIRGKKTPEKLTSTDLSVPVLSLPTYASCLLAARYNLRTCWEAFQIDRSSDASEVAISAEGSVARKSAALFPDLELHGVNFIGPFVASLLYRLDHMLENDIYSNLQLMGAINRIIIYPHSQLWTFIFSRNNVIEECGRSLAQIIVSLKSSVDTIIPASAFGKSLMERTYRSLLLRSDVVDSPTSETHSSQMVQQERSSKIGSFFGKNNNAKAPEKELIDAVFAEEEDAMLESIEVAGNSLRYRRRSSVAGSSDVIQLRSSAYSAALLNEFVQELAATCHERVLLTMLHCVV